MTNTLPPPKNATGKGIAHWARSVYSIYILRNQTDCPPVLSLCSRQWIEIKNFSDEDTRASLYLYYPILKHHNNITPFPWYYSKERCRELCSFLSTCEGSVFNLLSLKNDVKRLEIQVGMLWITCIDWSNNIIVPNYYIFSSTIISYHSSHSLTAVKVDNYLYLRKLFYVAIQLE